MTANYHTHTARCRHASGTEREYIETGIKNGLSVLGFSDHTPQIFPEGYYSNFRMFPEEAKGYFETVRALAKEYSSKIEIKAGLEVEYYPRIFGDLCDFLAEFEPDYLILGQHFIDNEFDTHDYSGNVHDKNGLKKYVDQTLEALETGKFSIFAHPDLIGYGEFDSDYEREMQRLCEGAKRLNVPLELNLLGLSEHRRYPRADFWRIAAGVGNDVVIGCDAHSPDRVAKPEELARVRPWMRTSNIAFDNCSLITYLGGRGAPAGKVKDSQW